MRSLRRRKIFRFLLPKRLEINQKQAEKAFKKLKKQCFWLRFRYISVKIFACGGLIALLNNRMQCFWPVLYLGIFHHDIVHEVHAEWPDRLIIRPENVSASHHVWYPVQTSTIISLPYITGVLLLNPALYFWIKNIELRACGGGLRVFLQKLRDCER